MTRPGAVVLAVLACGALVGPGRAAEDRAVEAASGYVLEYERQLTSIVADELYTQEVREQVPRVEGAPRQRRTKSEIFFVFVASDRIWMAIRDVMEVNGDAMVGGQDVREQLRTLPAWEVGSRMRAANSALNIGRVTRNFNEPTLALLTLDPEHRSRFRFDVGAATRHDGVTVVPIRFEEKERPTLIRGNGREPVFTKGELEVEPVTGRIWRSTLRASVSAVQLELTTDYAFDARLQMLLPETFRERYEEGSPRALAGSSGRQTAGYELILCEARYSNYRRFETTIRIR